MDVARRHLFTAAALGAAASALDMKAALAAPTAPKADATAQVFKLGDFIVAAVHEGVASGPLRPGFVRNVADAEVLAAYQAIGQSQERTVNTFTPLVVFTGRNLVLFDAGMADNGAPTTGKLVENLAGLGIKPADIDTVVISHFHGDHINGLRNKAGDLVFPNAEIVVPGPEWAFWMDDAKMNAAPEAARGGFQGARRVFSPIADKVRKIDWGKEVLPGITSVQADGHTPGHTAFLIASGNQQLMYVGDITNNPAIFARNPDWQVSFDMDGPRAVVTRKALLDRAASEKLRLAFYHGAFPSNGYVVKAGAGYEIVPAVWE
jgi:glyoxylase-like metal-dependent hydrolase (beta-lactamase superfamily II)